MKIVFYESLRQYMFEQDKRVKFVGTVYDKNLLLKIRENAQAYLHGHGRWDDQVSRSDVV